MDPKSVRPKLIESAPVGPLSPYIESYVTLVNEQGFAPSAVYEQIRVFGGVFGRSGSDARQRCAESQRASSGIRSFYHYAALEVPQHSGLIQRVLAIPYKRLSQPLVDYLTRSEVEALLATAC